jgi:hypothetical protein
VRIIVAHYLGGTWIILCATGCMPGVATRTKLNAAVIGIAKSKLDILGSLSSSS